MRIFGLIGIVFIGLSGPAFAQNIDFGYDTGDWTHDGECDDPRFDGPGMTSITLLVGDILRDATDCQTAYEAGQLQLRGVDASGAVNFGDDNGSWSNDGECDDMRFDGPGMTSTPLLFDDILHDATDCKTAFDAGRLQLNGVDGAVAASPANAIGDIEFGDDSGSWSNDGECDDMRFEGPGMTTTPLASEDIMHDASDCRAAYKANTITLKVQ